MIKRALNTQVEAQAAADAQMSELNRMGRQGSLTMSKGDASIKGGQRFNITGCRDGIDGEYLISTAVHTLTKDQGLTTRLEFYSEDGAGSSE